MKYMLLTYYDQDFDSASFAKDSPEAVRELIDFMRQLNAELEAAGELAYAEGLADPSETKTVRPKAGDAVTTDGPYAEAKEVLAGFWVVEVPSFERAAEIAARIVRYVKAPIEIRPIGAAPEV